MKRYLIISILLTIPVIAFANWMYLPGPGYSRSNSGSTPPIVVAEATTRTTNNSRLLNQWTIGNSFTVNSTTNFYSLSIFLEGSSNPSGTITCRLDDDNDMSSEYVEEFSLAFSGSTTEEWVEILSQTNPQLTSGTWYIACNSASAIDIAIEDSNLYAGGLYIYNTYPNWTTFSTIDTREMLFKVKAQ